MSILFKRGTAEKRNASNLVLAKGLPFFETDKNKLYIGDGTTALKSLTPIVENSNNTFTGNNTFYNDIYIAPNGSTLLNTTIPYVKYGCTGIEFKPAVPVSSAYPLNFPAKAGTFATTDDLALIITITSTTLTDNLLSTIISSDLNKVKYSNYIYSLYEINGNNRVYTANYLASGRRLTINTSTKAVTTGSLDSLTSHYTAYNYVGAANSASNAATTNGNTYLKLYDGSIKRSQFKIAGSGTTTVSSDADGNITINSTGTNYTAGTGISITDANVINHSNSITAGTAQGSASKTLTFGGTFTIPTVTYDAQGHITSIGTTTMTMPANPNSHYYGLNYVGAADSASNAATTNGNTYLKFYDGSIKRSQFKITGSGATTVSSDANGNITISSTNNTTSGGDTTYRGTSITGVSTTALIFSSSGIASAKVGDWYINTNTGNVYKCTTAGVASAAKWVYNSTQAILEGAEHMGVGIYADDVSSGCGAFLTENGYLDLINMANYRARLSADNVFDNLTFELPNSAGTLVVNSADNTFTGTNTFSKSILLTNSSDMYIIAPGRSGKKCKLLIGGNGLSDSSDLVYRLPATDSADVTLAAKNIDNEFSTTQSFTVPYTFTTNTKQGLVFNHVSQNSGTADGTYYKIGYSVSSNGMSTYYMPSLCLHASNSSTSKEIIYTLSASRAAGTYDIATSSDITTKLSSLFTYSNNVLTINI